MSWPIMTATSHSIRALRHPRLCYSSAHETLPVLVDFHWRSGKRMVENHEGLRDLSETFAYPPGIKRRGVQGTRGGVRERRAYREVLSFHHQHHATMLFLHVYITIIETLSARPVRPSCLFFTACNRRSNAAAVLSSTSCRYAYLWHQIHYYKTQPDSENTITSMRSLCSLLKFCLYQVGHYSGKGSPKGGYSKGDKRVGGYLVEECPTGG